MYPSDNVFSISMPGHGIIIPEKSMSRAPGDRAPGNRSPTFTIQMTGQNDTDTDLHWFAIKTRQDFKAETYMAEKCREVFFPKETVRLPDKKLRLKAVIPHVLFVRTTRDNLMRLEDEGRRHPESSLPFWVYRYPENNHLQTIPSHSIELLRLLTAEDSSKCRIYTVRDFKIKEKVRVTGGIYKGYEGFVKRIAKNRHVVVAIEGVCLVILPFIHPDLLERIE